MNDEEEILAELKTFTDAMEEQLIACKEKGGWTGCTDSYLFNQARGNLHEAHRILSPHCPECGHVRKIDRKEILKPLADTANFCMMLHNNIKHKLDAMETNEEEST